MIFDNSNSPPEVASRRAQTERNAGIGVVLVLGVLVVVEDQSADDDPNQKEGDSEREWDQEEWHEYLVVESRRRPG